MDTKSFFGIFRGVISVFNLPWWLLSWGRVGSLLVSFPGWGAAYDRCSEVVAWKTCAVHHTGVPIRRRCRRYECPSCYRDALKTPASRISDRLRGVPQAYRRARLSWSRGDYGHPNYPRAAPDDRFVLDCKIQDRWTSDRAGVASGGRVSPASSGGVPGLSLRDLDHGVQKTRVLRHFVFSPPKDEISRIIDTDELIDIFREKVGMAGLFGGVIVPHSHRITDGAKEALRVWRVKNSTAAKKRGYEEDYKGFWAMVKDDVLGWGDRGLYLEEGWHVHYVGFGYAMPSDEYYKRTGWVYHHIRDVDTAVVTDPITGVSRDPLADLVVYLLSHVPLRRTSSGKAQKMYRFLGACSLSSLRLHRPNGKKTLDSDISVSSPVLCPECQTQLTLYKPVMAAYQSDFSGRRILFSGGPDRVEMVHDTVSDLISPAVPCAYRDPSGDVIDYIRVWSRVRFFYYEIITPETRRLERARRRACAGVEPPSAVAGGVV